MWIKRTYGRSPGGGRRNKKNKKKVLPQAVCNQFDSIPDQHVTLAPNWVYITHELKVLIIIFIIF